MDGSSSHLCKDLRTNGRDGSCVSRKISTDPVLNTSTKSINDRRFVLGRPLSPQILETEHPVTLDSKSR